MKIVFRVYNKEIIVESNINKELVNCYTGRYLGKTTEFVKIKGLDISKAKFIKTNNKEITMKDFFTDLYIENMQFEVFMNDKNNSSVNIIKKPYGFISKFVTFELNGDMLFAESRKIYI